MIELTKFEKFIFWILDHKIWCKLGVHNWTATMDDYIEEFGTFNTTQIATKSVCSRCYTKYKGN